MIFMLGKTHHKTGLMAVKNFLQRAGFHLPVGLGGQLLHLFAPSCVVNHALNITETEGERKEELVPF